MTMLSDPLLKGGLERVKDFKLPGLTMQNVCFDRGQQRFTLATQANGEHVWVKTQINAQPSQRDLDELRHEYRVLNLLEAEGIE